VVRNRLNDVTPLRAIFAGGTTVAARYESFRVVMLEEWLRPNSSPT
jgi:hypothetical protein